MAFSTSFFALDPTEGQPLDTTSATDTMASAEWPQERQESNDGVDRIKREDDDMGADDNVLGHEVAGEGATEELLAKQSTPTDASTHDAPANGMPTNGSSPMGNKTTASKSLARKKRGTATAVKAPKRARHSGGKRGGSRGGGGAKKKPTTASSPGLHTGTSEDGGGENGAGPGGDGSSESDSGPYCLCRGPDNHRFMIACDRCEDWFHGECIGMDKWTGENLVQKYICPNCSDGKRYVTRYKKTCSLVACNRPARIYDPNEPSIFCSDDHCQAWWEQLIATLPKTKQVGFDNLTQEEFIGLLDSKSAGSNWRLGQTPFAMENNEDRSSDPLTEEELSILSRSAAERHALGEDIVLCKKMLQLVDMALKRREAAIAAGKGAAKDLCGYDARLDTVGVTRQFAAFLQTPLGEAPFQAGRLDYHPGPIEHDANGHFETVDSLTSGMCIKKKCKPHMGWSAILAKDVKHSMKEFARQAKQKLDAETRVRNSAVGRYQRKRHEENSVEVLYNSDQE